MPNAEGSKTQALRPTFLNFARIRFPAGAIASIGHRISGVLLALSLPFLVYALQLSLQSPSALSAFTSALRTFPGRIVLVVFAWACTHHLFAGIRHLLSDVGIGSALPAARASAYAVLCAGALVGLAAFLT